MRHSLLLTGMTICMLFLVGLTPGLTEGLEAQQHHERSGFWTSGGVGFGSLGFDGLNSRESGLSGNVTLGGTLTDRVLVGAGMTGWTKQIDGVRLTFTTLALMARVYPNVDSGLFINLGAGAGQVTVSAGGLAGGNSGGGAILGVGYDYRMGPGWSLSPYANAIAHSINGERADVFQFGMGVTRH
jgi:hypothetical protein